ncbi:MAG: hydantoinase B/oxoprolinase family protein [Proteobacteria bacterium]|nr:hydantoinase B/oxoprolinase family protein [Pseudomonadota bacterium]
MAGDKHTGWQFWVDRGGTFTDIVGRSPDGTLVSRKYLSDNPAQYKDAALFGIRDILGDRPFSDIGGIKLGTTVATNALLERTGARTLLVTTCGFADALLIGDQRRPELFALKVRPPTKLFEAVIEADQRHSAQGKVIKALDVEALKEALGKAYDSGIRSVAIAFLHADRFPEHEQQAAALARKAGFPHVVTSHETVPVMKFIPRASTCVGDAYLSPILKSYIAGVEAEAEGAPLYFMQSNGGLSEAHHFRGKDALLSGPAGGIVGAVRAASLEGKNKIISFDMGGTSTDVAHYDGAFERSEEEELEGVKLKVPSLKIHTVAAGGGSICSFGQGRLRVGPASAGANPGPACYRLGGPLTVTDCNLILGKLQSGLFPQVFGPDHNQQLDREAARLRIDEVRNTIKSETGRALSRAQAAEGFIRVAVEHMARAVKKISVQKGHDTTKYSLVSFGGAGGQHACAVADALGIETIIIHPLAGVLSALGIGLSGLMKVMEKTAETALDEKGLKLAQGILEDLNKEVEASLRQQGADLSEISSRAFLKIKYQGSDAALTVPFSGLGKAREDFIAAHQTLFGFSEPDKAMIIHSAQVVAQTPGEAWTEARQEKRGNESPHYHARIFFSGGLKDTPVYKREALAPGTVIPGPALIVEDHGANVIDQGWRAELSRTGNLVLSRAGKRTRAVLDTAQPDLILLEIFNNRFMTIAEEMGAVLENTAHSVNIKERLDFSCALFDGQGELVANAPHMPVHLGSMSQSVKTIALENAGSMKPGDVFLLNDPYHGGTHLPDLTVVLPVYLKKDTPSPEFYVAARGHHADIGGITPGSMPPNSKTIGEEGVLFTNFPVIREGRFREAALMERLTAARWPARNPSQNIADIKAMVAACRRGITSLMVMCAEFGFEAVFHYMAFIQDNAEAAVREVIDVLEDGEVCYPLDNGLEIKLAIRVDKATRTAVIDFSGASAQAKNNFNAPKAVTVAAVLYVFRCLVGQDIPLNAGCLKPLKLIIPERSFLNPEYPAAVVAGNVETSQAVTNALLLALGKLAAAQGTMNNLTFGNEKYQYYETIAGGYGAGNGFDGAHARQVHMTNSRLTDPEVLEWRFPVVVEEFSIRPGSGGAGKWRGGNGTTRKIRVLEDMEMSILSSHRELPPPGLAGGAPGQCGENTILRHKGTRNSLKGCDHTDLKAGDIIEIRTPGGGGYGKEAS